MKVKISEVFRNLSVTKRVILGSITLLVMGYMFCLPRQLFHIPYSTYLAQRGASVVAFDYSKKMIELAKRQIGRAHV